VHEEVEDNPARKTSPEPITNGWPLCDTSKFRSICADDCSTTSVMTLRLNRTGDRKTHQTSKTMALTANTRSTDRRWILKQQALAEQKRDMMKLPIIQCPVTSQRRTRSGAATYVAHAAGRGGSRMANQFHRTLATPEIQLKGKRILWMILDHLLK
jgi:hypothetical protein